MHVLDGMVMGAGKDEKAGIQVKTFSLTTGQMGVCYCMKKDSLMTVGIKRREPPFIKPLLVAIVQSLTTLYAFYIFIFVRTS